MSLLAALPPPNMARFPLKVSCLLSVGERMAQFSATDQGRPARKVVLGSTSGRTPASTGSGTLPYVARGPGNTRNKDWWSSRSTRRSSDSRKTSTTSARACEGQEDRFSHRDRQRLCDLARLRQPLLAGALHHRCARADSTPQFGEGGYRKGRKGSSAAAGRAMSSGIVNQWAGRRPRCRKPRRIGPT